MMNSCAAKAPGKVVLPWEALARMRIFWLGLGGLIVISALTTKGLADIPAFVLIATTAVLPAFLWCRGMAHGIPIFPIFALGTLSTFGFPLLGQQPLMMQYATDERLAAAATIAMTNLIGTGFWFLLVHRIPAPPSSYLGFRFGSGDALFFAALIAEIAFGRVTQRA